MSVKSFKTSGIKVDLAPQGLVLLNTTSFSGVASQNITNVFSSTYENYKIIWTIDSISTAASEIRFRLGTSGTPLTTNTYFSTGVYVDGGAPQGVSGPGTYLLGYSGPASYTGQINGQIELSYPQKNTKTSYEAWAAQVDAFRYWHVIAGNTTVQSFTDIQIFPSANNITGSISVYGYNK
jgi:hypothetical protein